MALFHVSASGLIYEEVLSSVMISVLIEFFPLIVECRLSFLNLRLR